MAGDLNEVTLLGNMGDAPEFREFSNGKGVANFSIATSRGYKDKDGQWQEVTEWHKVCVYDPKLIEWLQRSAVKGTRVWLRGELKTRSYEAEGGKKYVTEIVLNPYQGQLKFQARTKGEGMKDALNGATPNPQEQTGNVIQETPEDVIPF